jgi:hypothetical protein
LGLLPKCRCLLRGGFNFDVCGHASTSRKLDQRVVHRAAQQSAQPEALFAPKLTDCPEAYATIFN